MSSMDSTQAALALSQNIKIGARTFAKLRALGKLNQVITFPVNKLIAAGIPQETAILIRKTTEVNIDAIIQRLQRFNISYIVYGDKNYPRLLNEIPDPPGVLYYSGSLKALDNPTLAVVGSRKATSYGAHTTRKLVADLTSAGLTIISGLALGIDGIAHQTALDNNGKTVAILGNGLDTIYPSSHTRLAQDIISNGGCLISEYSPGTPSYPAHFPIRNRIIAGISLGVVVVEASLQSGSLHTARAALDYNREVFAIPHQLFSQSGEGPNQLISEGATVVLSSESILQALNLQVPSSKSLRTDDEVTPQEQLLLQLLTKQPIHLDDIIVAIGNDAAQVTATLTILELRQRIRNVGGKRYVKVW